MNHPVEETVVGIIYMSNFIGGRTSGNLSMLLSLSK